MRDRVKMRASGICWKRVDEQPRRPRVIERGTRPVHTVAPLDASVADPSVVRDAAARRASQLVEDRLRAGLRELFPMTESPSKLRQYFDVGPHAVWRLDRSPPHQHPSLQVCERTVLLRPLRRRQNHVRKLRGFRKEEIDDDKKLERLESFTNDLRVGCGDGDI